MLASETAITPLSTMAVAAAPSISFWVADRKATFAGIVQRGLEPADRSWSWYVTPSCASAYSAVADGCS